MTTPETDPRARILDAALLHVPFDGWSEATLAAAARDAGVERALARSLFPRGPRDLALAYHRRGDARMADALRAEPRRDLRFRDRIAHAVRTRLQQSDREAVRRGATLFSLPQNAADGARSLWETADAIWTALGDSSDDLNWYSKRASLAGVYGSTVLFWLGDDSAGQAETWAFLDRRIEDVMRIEKAKAAVAANPLGRALSAPLGWAASKVRPPMRMPVTDLPGSWTPPR